MDAMLALLTEDKKPGCLFLGLFLERLPVEMRDHLVSREFKNPSEMALYADSLWDTRKAIPTDHLLAAASTSLSFPSRGRTQDHRSPSPNCRSQTPGPSNSVLFPPTLWSCSQQPTASLKFPGKRQSRREEEKLISLPVGGYLMCLQDALSNRDYLVDTGASRSVFPHRSSAAPTGPW